MDADDLVLYLVDHGGNGVFRMSETEILTASQLNYWLSTFQSSPCPDKEILNTSFSSGANPAGWTVTDNTGSGALWRFNAPGHRGNLSGGSGFFAVANSDYEGEVDMDTELRTPLMDASNLSTVILEFKTDFLYYPFGGAEVADVDVSVNGVSGPWTNVWRKTGADYRGPATENIDITAVAAGQQNLMVRFRYYNANYDFWWQVDDVKVTGTLNQCHTVTLIYDACESGSFLQALPSPPDRKRIVISSADVEEKAIFALQGTLSFSESFWTWIFKGADVKTAFDAATDALAITPSFRQRPLLDDTGNGLGNEDYGQAGVIEQGDDGYLARSAYIGNGTVVPGDTPVIGGVTVSPSLINGQSWADITASGVTDADNGISRVWAIILPDDLLSGASDNAIQDFPHIDLMPTGVAGEYRGTYDGFTSEGLYDIFVFASDRDGNSAAPAYASATVGANPLRRRAILVAAGTLPDPTGDELWPAVENNVTLAYKALKEQGYADDDMYILSPLDLTGVKPKDSVPTPGNLQSAVESWAAADTHDVVLYMIGNGDTGQYFINATETVAADTLKVWLDNLQTGIGGNKITVIYDAPYSGAYSSALATSGEDRILIGSSGNTAYFQSGGDISFSHYLWSKVLNGWNVRDAYLYAASAMEFSTNQEQMTWIDDNGNGIGNESYDGAPASKYTIGMGIRFAGKDPLIGSVSADPNPLTGQLSTTLTAEDVTTVGILATDDPVWAVVTHPKGPYDSIPTQTTVVLSPIGGETNDYTAVTPDIFTRCCWYSVTVYAKDNEGNVSAVSETKVYQQGLDDLYEPDNSYEQAKPIILDDGYAQQHNFFNNNDEDWVKFYAVTDEEFTFEAKNVGLNSNVKFELFDEEGVTANPPIPLATWNNGGNGASELHYYPIPNTGHYYLRVTNVSGVYGNDTGYDLSIYEESGTTADAHIWGFIKDTSGNLVSGVTVVTNGYSYTSDASGYYYNKVTMSAQAENHTTNASKSLYCPNGSSRAFTSGVWYYPIYITINHDNDGDGYGSPGSATCSGGSAPDCNDSNAAINPIAMEVCDGADNNCSSVIDEGYTDTDSDGVADCVDSDDDNDGMSDGSDNCPLTKPSKVGGAYYNTMQEAYDNAGNGTTIQCQDLIFSGDMYIDLDKAVTIRGGYDCSYSTSMGTTTIEGNMTISNGTATLENVQVQ
ncbi:MAG: hypothetical protein C4538_10505 [Nitrospiraceae bacterium]|nr:MAG: hypothetical protein C4538_10505 [Nitrospiraceae bacterium]